MLASPVLESASTAQLPMALDEIGINHVRNEGWRQGQALRDEIGIYHARNEGWRWGRALRDEIGIHHVRNEGWRRGHALGLDSSVVPSGQRGRLVDRYCYGQ